MPGFLTEFVNNQVLDCFFGGMSITPPPTLYVGLSLTRSYKGGYASEPPGGSYARVALPNNLVNFPAATSGTKTNGLAITFPAPSETWGAISSVFIADAASGGNVLAMADLPDSRAINGGDPAPLIAVDALFLSHI
jgi:hypothetical protein